MTEKSNFIEVFKGLSKEDEPVVKEVIALRCKWGGPNLFYKKMSAERAIPECSQKGLDEFMVIESVTKCFEMNAWTAVKLTTHTLTHEASLN